MNSYEDTATLKWWNNRKEMHTNELLKMKDES